MNLLQNCLQKARFSDTSYKEIENKNEHLHKCTDSSSDRKKRDPVNEYMIKMLSLIRELLIFCFILMVYSTITKEPPKVTKVMPAYPFFSKNSIVKDFYRGEIIAAIEHARMNDLSFVMFYAPWDAASRASKREFLKTAKFMKDSMIFVAINCWQPDSDCRTQYTKVYRWPIVIAYPSFGMGIRYNGPISAPYMISFINKIILPVKKINETHLKYEEGFIVAELNAFPTSIEYSIYYTVSLKYLEIDYAGKITFYIKPVKVTQNRITLYLWNQKRVMHIQPGMWNVQSILQWIIKNSESPTSWVMPTGSKSLLLSDHLQPGPTLILFSPYNPLHSASDYYLVLQEIAQEYRNCQNGALNFDIKTKRLNNLLEYKGLKRSCGTKKNIFSKLPKYWSITTSTTFFNSSTERRRLSNESSQNCNALEFSQSSHSCQTLKVKNSLCIQSQLLDPIKNGRKRYEHQNFDITEKMGRNYHTLLTSMWNKDTDSKSMTNLRKLLQMQKCKNYMAAEKLHPNPFVLKDASNSKWHSMSNLTCSSANNQSLNFFAIDSLRFYMLAERLGLNLSKATDMTAVVILDDMMETHYVLKERITINNLRKFIRQFSNNSLERSRESNSDVPSKNSPHYPSKLREANDTRAIWLKELNGKTFLPFLMQPNKASLIMYYSKQCSYCNGISHKLLAVARKLSFVDNIQFARIDGDINILPWEYTVEKFPTILFIPSNRKEETRVFPADISVTVSNLLGFIMANADLSMKLHIIYSTCLHTQIQKNKDSCFRNLRNYAVSLTGEFLRKWRKSSYRQRHVIMYHLKYLRELQFIFSHSTEDYILIDSYLKKLQMHLIDNNKVNYSTEFIKYAL